MKTNDEKKLPKHQLVISQMTGKKYASLLKSKGNMQYKVILKSSLQARSKGLTMLSYAE